MGGPPGRALLATLMSDAELASPHSQELRFATTDSECYLLTVTYLSRAAAEPTWVLSTDKEVPPRVFWSITTENPEQIYNLILKRSRSAGARGGAAPVEVVQEAAMEAPPLTKMPTIPRPQPTGYVFLNRYEITDEVGCGGMSRVYRAYDMKSDRAVALKVLHPHLLSESSTKNPKKRFEQEFKATMALGHANIVKVYDYGFTNEGLPFIIMEFLDGQSLEEILQYQKSLRLTQFLTIFYQVCTALAHAHIRGVIHRDVKPSNIMLVKSEQGVELVKLLDFGIAKVEGLDRLDHDTMQKLTQTGDVFGSPYYMSPEQCKGEKLDARSDIYSLGCVMYQSAVGRRPFEGENAYKTIYMHVNIRPPSFGMVKPGTHLPTQMEAIILKCLEKEPHLRYQTAQALSLDLQKLAQEKDEGEDSWVTRQTRSGTFYAVHPTTGKEEPANVMSVLKLLENAGIIDEKCAHDVNPSKSGQFSEVGKQLVERGVIDAKTLHSAVQCQALIERGEMKIEKAIIALHYCQRSRISLEEALEELGWNASEAH